MTDHILAKALDAMRSHPVYQKSTKEQQEALEKIVRKASEGGTAASLAASFAMFVARPILDYYEAEAPVVQDMLTAFFNAFKTAIVAETLMEIFPDPNDAPDEIVVYGAKLSKVYKESCRTYNALAGSMMDDRLARQKP